MTLQPRPEPETHFDWSLYRDATLAGLSLLVPVPFVDSAFEWFFRRRIPLAVARRRGQVLRPDVLAEINRGDQGCLESCLVMPIWLAVYVVKKLSKKVLYFLTVKDATDQLSNYWQTAFLIDYALRAGHLGDLRSAQVAKQAWRQVRRARRYSPLIELARQVVASPGLIWRSLRRARRGQEDATIRQKQSAMAAVWSEFGGHLRSLAAGYDQAFVAALAAREAAEVAAAARAAERAREQGSGGDTVAG